MTEVSEAPTSRLSPWTLASDGFGALSKLPAGIWVGWAAFAAYDAASRRLAWSMGIIAPHHTETSWRYTVWALAASLGTALASGPTFRALVRGRPGLWRLDKGFLSYVLLGLTAGVVPLLLSLLMPAAGGVPGNGGLLIVALFRSLIGLAAYVILLVVEVRLILWPIGLVLGEPGITASRSWSLMRGQVLRFVVAVAIAEVIPGVAALTCAGRFLHRGDLMSLLLEEVFLVLGLVLATGVGASFYRQLKPEA